MKIENIKNGVYKNEEEKEKLVKSFKSKLDYYRGSYISGNLHMKSKIINDLLLKNYTDTQKLGGEGRYREAKNFENWTKIVKSSQIKIINYKIILN